MCNNIPVVFSGARCFVYVVQTWAKLDLLENLFLGFLRNLVTIDYY